LHGENTPIKGDAIWPYASLLHLFEEFKSFYSNRVIMLR